MNSNNIQTIEPYISWDVIEELSTRDHTPYNGWSLRGRDWTEAGKADWLDSNFAILLLERESDGAWFRVTINGARKEVLGVLFIDD